MSSELCPRNEDIDYALMQAAEAANLRGDLSLAAEAIELLQGMLADLVKVLRTVATEFDADEYADDLERVATLAAIVR